MSVVQCSRTQNECRAQQGNCCIKRRKPNIPKPCTPSPCPTVVPCCTTPTNMRYIQPAVVKSFKPNRLYTPPCAALESNTVYKLSYEPQDTRCCKGTPFRAKDNLEISGNFRDETTQKHDYRCWPGAQAARPVLPCNRNLLGDGPMQSLTTQKHDYVPKPFSKMDPIIPPHQMLASDCPMEDTSIMVASYQPPDPCKTDPAVSFKPQTTYKQPQYPFQDDTVQKLSYVPWPICNKEVLPWAAKNKYSTPCSPMDGNTIYKTSYLPNCPGDRQKPIKHEPAGNLLSDTRYFADTTIYRESYLPVNAACCKQPAFKAIGNLTVPTTKFGGDTTQKHDYRCWPGAQAAQAVLPCNRNLLGDGPMQSLTTQKHDYVPKPFSKMDPIIPPHQMLSSNCPMEDTSIMVASYQPPDPCKMDPAVSFKPQTTYKQPQYPFQDDTVQKLSYVPWPICNKEVLPWAAKNKYSTPCSPMDGNTIYKTSYLPNCPGDRQKPIKHEPAGNLLSDTRNFADTTIYRESYLPVNAACCKQPAFKAIGNLTVPTTKFGGDTTQKHDYRCWPGAQAAQPVLPCNRNLLGDGPMQSLTTQKHDYVPKPFSKMDPIIPPHQMLSSNCPMEDTSIMVASYQPPDPCKTDPAVSFKPQTTYKQPQYPFQDDTVQKLSYVPWPICNKEVLPWAAKNKYSTPCSPMDGNTIYNTSYLPNCPGDRQKPIKHEPAGNLLSDTRNFADTTIYRESYLPVNAACCKQPAFKAIGNLTVPTTKFGGDTTQKHDYRCWPGAQAAQAVLPCNRNLLGDGPMQSLTTQKHDYVPKPFSKMDPIIPPHQMLSSNCPMEDTSIMVASYQPPDPCKMDPAVSFKPQTRYRQPQYPFQDDTIQKLSYVPWPICNKEMLPWAGKARYKCPTSPMEADTVYKTSYFPPGRFVPAGQVCNPCTPCSPKVATSSCKGAACFDQCCRGINACG